ncbi:MAG: hypothetical protein JXB33_05180, partial [Clostridia bacterium]|nr:hypothetical protein [Clostridia bacterium]
AEGWFFGRKTGVVDRLILATAGISIVMGRLPVFLAMTALLILVSIYKYYRNKKAEEVGNEKN